MCEVKHALYKGGLLQATSHNQNNTTSNMTTLEVAMSPELNKIFIIRKLLRVLGLRVGRAQTIRSLGVNDKSAG